MTNTSTDAVRARIEHLRYCNGTQDLYAALIEELAAERDALSDQLAAANTRADKARDAALVEAAKVCEDQKDIFLSPEYAVNQPLSSFPERFACGECHAAILALRDKPAETAPQSDLCSTSEPQLAPAVTVQEADRDDIVETITEIIGETHDINVHDHNYAEAIVRWLEQNHPAAFRAIAGGRNG